MKKNNAFKILLSILFLSLISLLIFVYVNKEYLNKVNNNDVKEEIIENEEDIKKIQFNLLYSCASDIYEQKKYLKLKKNEKNIYYATAKDLQSLGYKTDKINIKNCNQNDPIILFDIERKEEDKYFPIKIILDCSFKNNWQEE